MPSRHEPARRRPQRSTADMSPRRRKILAEELTAVAEFAPVEVVEQATPIAALRPQLWHPTDVQRHFIRELAIYEGLPRPVRHLLQETIAVWKAREIADFLDRHMASGNPLDRAYAIDAALRAIRAAEWQDLLDEARKYELAWRLPYPHLAAGATIQRYGNRDY